METLSVSPSLCFLHRQAVPVRSSWGCPNGRLLRGRSRSFKIMAAKLPAGIDLPQPREEPKVAEPFLGFTKTAEVWNSRACMIGLIGTFVVELIFHKGILQMIGVDIGKGLDLPLWFGNQRFQFDIKMSIKGDFLITPLFVSATWACINVFLDIHASVNKGSCNHNSRLRNL